MKKSLIAAALCLTGCSAQPDPEWSAQLYTVRAEMETDMEGTLRRIADLGYDGVEFAGFYDRDPQDVRAMLSEFNLRPVASHIWWEDFRDDPRGAIDATKALGAPVMVLAWMPEETRDTRIEWDDWIERLNNVGEQAKAEGLRLAYHNHEFEFVEVDGIVPYDLLLERLDPELVEMELDIYWTVLGGRDPVELAEAYPGRFTLSHVKDMAREGIEMVDVGDGRIDFCEIIPKLRALGMTDFIVEHDSTQDRYSTLDRSLSHLKGC